MPLILALDIATVTAFATCQKGAAFSTIQTGLMRATGTKPEDKAASLALCVDDLLRQIKPDFVAIKQPIHVPFSQAPFSITKHENQLLGRVEKTIMPPYLIHTPIMTGAVIAVLSTLQIPYISMQASLYRKHFLGTSRMPNYQKADWQKASADKARSLNIPLKSIQAAEAIAMLLTTLHCQEFKLFDLQRTTKSRQKAMGALQ